MTWTISRRDACCAGVGVFIAGVNPVLSSEIAQDASPPTNAPIGPGGDYRAMRGAAAGRQAMLRAAGHVFVERDGAEPQPAWALEENTLVSWHAGEGGILTERREGRLTLRPLGAWGPRKDVEIVTGPVTEPLVFDAARVVMAKSARRHAVIMATPALPPEAAWLIADQPDDARLPVGVSSVRVFSRDAADLARPITVAWAMRSPWLSQLAPAPERARLMWRATGGFAGWRRSDAALV